VAFRTATYNAIVRILYDLRWHDVSELERVTGYPADWLRELQHDRRFDIDAERGRLRLRLPRDSDHDGLAIR
jgi:hypothetical protein